MKTQTLLEDYRPAGNNRQHFDQLVEERIEGFIDFRVPAVQTSHGFFALDDRRDLVVVVEDDRAGEIECEVDFDDVVDSLLATLDEEPAQTPDARRGDIAMLTALAQRFQTVAARLHAESRRRATVAA